MTVAMGWKKKAPLLLVVAVIAGLAIVTMWVRQSRIDRPADDVRAEADAAPSSATGDTESSQSRAASRRAGMDTRLSGAEMQDRVQAIVARRARLRDESENKAQASRQKAAAAYRTEKVDKAWATQKETELSEVATSEALAQAKIVPKAFEVDCKTTVCRLNGTFSTLGEAEDWTLYYMSSVGNALPNSVVSKTQNPDGTTNVEIYGRAR